MEPTPECATAPYCQNFKNYVNFSRPLVPAKHEITEAKIEMVAPKKVPPPTAPKPKKVHVAEPLVDPHWIKEAKLAPHTLPLGYKPVEFKVGAPEAPKAPAPKPSEAPWMRADAQIDLRPASPPGGRSLHYYTLPISIAFPSSRMLHTF